MLKNIKGSMLIVMAALLVFSCADPNKSPIVTFDSAGKGAYPRLTDSQGEQLVNILSQADFDASSFTWSLRFIDVNQGADVAEYALNVIYETVDGVKQGPVELKKFSSADFTTDETGFIAINNVTITASELTGTFGLSLADLTAGDEFQLRGVLVMNDGSIHNGDNSSAAIPSAAFQGFFDFNMAVGCPSDLTGTFDYTTDLSPGGWFADGDVDNNPVTGTVDIEALGGGKYTFSDWSFGGYAEVYGGGSASGQMGFTDVCTVATFNGGADSYGDNWTVTATIEGTDVLLLEWRNDYAGGYEGGDTRITFPGGVPFTLAP